MDPVLLGWIVFSVYAVATAALAFVGMRRTKDLASFALGNGDLGPVITGITLAASIASTATFVINPGFVYAHGVSALMHLGVASWGGVLFGLALLSGGFRRLGLRTRALTLPQWIGARWDHRPMRTYFAVVNLVLAISFVVLIVKGSALVMQHTLGLGYVASLGIIVAFVFSYILMGGTYAHVFTNALQGGMMVLVAIAIVLSGAHLFGDGIGAFFARIEAADPNLVALVNPKSALFDSVWSVYVSGFVVGVGLVAQPHILTKSLYLAEDRQVPRYLLVGGAICVVYALVLIAGLYARLEHPGIAAQDAVMPTYLSAAFPPMAGVLISVALLAAGMSTLDGILVSASTIAAHDLLARRFAGRDELALKGSRWFLVGMGVVSFLVALDPPKLVGIFAQVGIYGLVSASIAPIVFGVLSTRVAARDVFAGAIVGPLVHFAHYGVVVYGLERALNPAVSATSGILASFATVLALGLLRAPAAAAVPDGGLHES